MAREADFDVDLFVENVRTGRRKVRSAGRYSMVSEKPESRPDQSRKKLKLKK
ncbi:MAG: hypothetical protein ACJ72Z_05160 [Pyrinomonadaceae bacterium]